MDITGCDLVIFTADWVPDLELAALAGCELDAGTRGPLVDTSLRTTVPGVFAAGNLIHAAETADVSALTGRHAAGAIAAHLTGDESWPTQLPIEAEAPLRWISPNLLAAAGGPPPRERFLLRSDAFLRAPRVEVTQDGRELWSRRLPRLVPGRSAHIPADWIAKVEGDAGPVSVRVS